MIRSLCRIFGIACGYRAFDSALDRTGFDAVLDQALAWLVNVITHLSGVV
jgi:hypothetical protein